MPGWLGGKGCMGLAELVGWLDVADMGGHA